MPRTDVRPCYMTGEQLEAEIAKLQISKTYFAQMLGVDQRTVRRWLNHNGRAIPATVPIILKLMAQHDVSPDEIKAIFVSLPWVT